MIGISMGGIETWLAAAADDRVKVAVPAIAVQSFRWSLENDRWQGRANTIQAAHEAAAKDLGEPRSTPRSAAPSGTRSSPASSTTFDCPSLLRLFAGRAAADRQRRARPELPDRGGTLAIDSAREAFRAAGAEDRLKVIIAEGVAHKVTDEQNAAILDWCESWLRP